MKKEFCDEVGPDIDGIENIREAGFAENGEPNMRELRVVLLSSNISLYNLIYIFFTNLDLLRKS